jgi:hypothetical protein
MFFKRIKSSHKLREQYEFFLYTYLIYIYFLNIYFKLNEIFTVNNYTNKNMFIFILIIFGLFCDFILEINIYIE